MFRVDDYVKPIPPKPVVTPEPKPPVQDQTTTVAAAKISEAQNVGAANKAKLEKQYAANQPTPYKAQEQINNLPQPDPTDQAAVEKYKEQRRAIAEDAIKNSRPPKLEDFRKYGLNGPTAELEYGDAKTAYDSQIRDLQKISADAVKYPDKILNSAEARQEIDNLPRPNRSDPQSVREYNNRRAAIADSALMYATAPQREDFLGHGLNGRTADFEFREALSSFNSTVSELKDYADVRGTTLLPPMTDTEINQAANRYIAAHNGVKNEDDARAVGSDLATLAQTDAEGAVSVMKKVQEKLNGTTFGDNVASGFVDKSSVEQLRDLSLTADGRAMLDNLKDHLLAGDVHDGEKAQADKIDLAVTGYDEYSLEGFPAENAQTVDKQLQSLPPAVRERYLQAVFNDESGRGRDALNHAAEMSPEGRKALGDTLSAMYAKDALGTIKLIESASSGNSYGPHSRSGMANAIAASGNESLIKDYAAAEIKRGQSILKEGDDVNNEAGKAYLNAMTVYAGLSPESLQKVMADDSKTFNETLDKAITTETDLINEMGDVETGLGALLKTASQIKGADGKLTPEAINLFEKTVANDRIGRAAREGAGAFFIENAQQLVDKYTDPLNGETLSSETLKNFFGNVVYSPYSKDLRYNGGSLVEAIIGDEKGEGGVIGDVVQNYLDRANKTGEDLEQDTYIGQRIGFLWNGLSGGFIKGVQNYKDEWKDKKELRDFTFDMLGRGLGKIADKVGLPGALIEKPLSLVQGIFEAKAEKDRDTQLEKFKDAFNALNDAMYIRLNNYDAANDKVQGLNSGFTSAYGWQAIKGLLDETIKDL